MSWNELEQAPASPDAKENILPLQQAIYRAVYGPEQKPLRDYLRAVVRAPSFAVGRDAVDVAYREGFRAFATKLLGEFNE